MFEAVILAGGQGTRLKSVTGELPKPMVDMGGTPFLYRLMQRLEGQGCSRIVLSLCYQADYIVERVRADKPISIPVDFVIETTPLGTGGAIKLAANVIKADKFLVLNGDTFSDIDYQALMDYALQADLVICGVYIEDVSRYGTLELGTDKAVLAMYEKGRSGPGFINSGTYVITTADIKAVDATTFSFEQNFVQGYQRRFKAFVSNGYFIDIGIPEDYYRACQTLS